LALGVKVMGYCEGLGYGLVFGLGFGVRVRAYL